MTETIHIALAIDDNYVQHTGVMLTSLFENNKNNSIHIYLFSATLSRQNQEIIEAIVKKYEQQFSFIPLSDNGFKNYFVSYHISVASYYRIVIPRIMAEYGVASTPLPLILYLDADMIVLKDLLPLWKTNIHNKIIGAVKESTFGNPKRLHYPDQYNYFNAGVLLINIEEWNAGDTTHKLVEYINLNASSLIYWDQDALNAVLYDQWQELSPIWNQQSAMFETPYKYLLKIYNKKELDATLNAPVIIHYAGPSKPWQYLNIHPYKDLYPSYIAMTKWKNYKPGIKPKDRVKKIFMFLNLVYKKINYYLVPRDFFNS